MWVHIHIFAGFESLNRIIIKFGGPVLRTNLKVCWFSQSIYDRVESKYKWPCSLGNAPNSRLQSLSWSPFSVWTASRSAISSLKVYSINYVKQYYINVTSPVQNSLEMTSWAWPRIEQILIFCIDPQPSLTLCGKYPDISNSELVQVSAQQKSPRAFHNS